MNFTMDMINFVNKTNTNDCTINTTDILQKILGTTQSTVLYGSIALVVCVICWFVIEIMKLNYAPTDITKLRKYLDNMGFFQRALMFVVFLISTRMLQVVLWSL